MLVIFLVSPLVVSEVCYFLARDQGPDVEAAFLESLTTGHLVLATLSERDLPRMAELVRKYADLTKTGLGGADASVIALAERPRITDVATIDRRHFSVVRPRHCASFTLLP
ncbi:MAG TPA: PIN domain-containing protein [Actinophytocola sp.]|nr:PIN domain-containing protein [Actinophytocola sp.]